MILLLVSSDGRVAGDGGDALEGTPSQAQAGTPAATTQEPLDWERAEADFAAAKTIAKVSDLLEVWVVATTAQEGDMLRGLDDLDRHDTVRMPLHCTQQFTRLRLLATQPHLTQRQAIDLFRHDMKDCGPDSMLPAIRKLEFKRRNDGSRTIEHGKESLGKSIELQVTGAGEIDDYVTFRVPVYTNPGTHLVVGVQCSIDLEPEKEQIVIKPLPDQLETAMQEAQQFIHEKLGESGAVVFFGTP